MESGMYFAVFVFGIGAMHLVWKAVAYMDKMSNTLGLSRMNAKKLRTKRADWYMFFHISDLTGHKKEKDSETYMPDSERVLQKQNGRKRRRSGSRIHL